MFYNLDQKPSIFTPKTSMPRKFMCTHWQCVEQNQNIQKLSFCHHGKFEIFVPFFPCNLLFEETGSLPCRISHRLVFAECIPWCCLMCSSNLSSDLNCFCKDNFSTTAMLVILSYSLQTKGRPDDFLIRSLYLWGFQRSWISFLSSFKCVNEL